MQNYDYEIKMKKITRIKAVSKTDTRSRIRFLLTICSFDV